MAKRRSGFHPPAQLVRREKAGQLSRPRLVIQDAVAPSGEGSMTETYSSSTGLAATATVESGTARASRMSRRDTVSLLWESSDALKRVPGVAGRRGFRRTWPASVGEGVVVERGHDGPPCRSRWCWCRAETSMRLRKRRGLAGRRPRKVKGRWRDHDRRRHRGAARVPSAGDDRLPARSPVLLAQEAGARGCVSVCSATRPGQLKQRVAFSWSTELFVCGLIRRAASTQKTFRAQVPAGSSRARR